MTATNQTPLSSTYWDLHRNTLLFSSLLLVICIPGVTVESKQSFLWLSFNNVAFNGLRLIAAIAATYCFMAYVLEWRSDALVVFRRESGLAESSRQRADELISLASEQPAEALKSWLNSISNLAGDVPTHAKDRNYIHPLLKDIADKAIHSFPEEMIDHNFKKSLPMNLYTGSYGPAFDEQDFREASYRGMKVIARQVVAHTVKVTCDNMSYNIIHSIEHANLCAERVSKTLEELNTPKGRFQGLLNQSRISLISWRTTGYVRLIVLGLWVPTGIYLIAIAHLAGQLGPIHLTSFLAMPHS